MAKMSLKYITEGSLPIRIQKIDRDTGRINLSLEVEGVHWLPLFEEKTWTNRIFSQVHLFSVSNNICCFHDSIPTILVHCIHLFAIKVSVIHH